MLTASHFSEGIRDMAHHLTHETIMQRLHAARDAGRTI
jgi:hypothetical protein